MGLPKPYYDRDGITIYHADCRDILPLLEPGSVDLVLTDPPYPKLKGGVNVTFDRGVGQRRSDSVTLGEPWGNDLSALAECERIASLGAMCFASWQSLEMVPPLLGGQRCALVTWFKRNSQPSNNNAPHYQTEFVWCVRYAPGLNWRALRTFYDIPKLQAGCMATERIVDRDGRARHRAQKPVRLVSELLKVGGGTILDPFMGSGTTLRAAKDLGRRAIGIEIEEKYCDIAVRRLAQGVLPFGD
jgi:site-specific DNA-methyltransferase (adenine-specific)